MRGHPGRSLRSCNSRPMKRPLRILVAHNVSKSRNGGMSRIMGYVHDYVVQAGHVVDYFCAEDFPQAFRGRSARFVFPLMVFQRARDAARSDRPYDVINVHEPSGSAIALLKRMAGGPRVVITSYGVEERGWARVLEEARLGRENVRPLSRLFFPASIISQSRLALSHADHVFCSNMEDYEYLTSRLRIARTKLTRMHSGADCVYARAACNRDYSKAERLLFAGTWLKRKGTCDLVPAFVQLATRHPELRLVILNGFVPESEIRSYFPEQVRSRVICQKAEPERGIAEAMAATDIYLLPSLFEGTPVTLIEAMFEGMPIVTTSTSGMKDVIEDGRNGMLVPVRSPDAIVTAVELLLDNPELRARLGRAAREEAVQRYNWKRVAEPLLKVYEQLCGRTLADRSPGR
jgi:glycosyltransferase involved in cell wall biosynthesis